MLKQKTFIKIWCIVAILSLYWIYYLDNLFSCKKVFIK